jgi:hypothetical protein
MHLVAETDLVDRISGEIAARLQEIIHEELDKNAPDELRGKALDTHNLIIDIMAYYLIQYAHETKPSNVLTVDATVDAIDDLCHECIAKVSRIEGTNRGYVPPLSKSIKQ